MTDPTLFSLGSLRLTQTLIESRAPLLAHRLYNLTLDEPVIKDSLCTENCNTYEFPVSLPGDEIKDIVDALMANCEENTQSQNNPGQVLLAKSLIDEWMGLVHKMIEQND